MKRNENGIVLAIELMLFGILVVVLLVVFTRVLSQLDKAPEPTVQTASSELLRGFSFSPKSLNGSDLTDFFDKAKEHGTVVTWAGDWQELEKQSGGPNLVFSQSSKRKLTSVALVTTHKDVGQGKVAAIRPLIPEQNAAYVQLARDFSTKFKPKYFGVGIEVNRIAESSKVEYDQFVALFNQTVDAVHEVSPLTQVFPTFQLERLRGLRGGLYGGVNNEQVNDWRLLDDFAKADMLGFTTYPGLIFKSPSKIPDDYYQSIREHTKKPMVISELGWSAASTIKGWESDETKQAEFVDRFSVLIKDLKPKMLIWSFLYDPQAAKPFDSMGLISTEGKERQALGTFKSIR